MNGQVFSEHVLERYLLGELPSEETKEVERAAAADPRLRSAIDALEASNRDILARYPAASFKAGLLDRLREGEAPRPTWRRRTAFAAACAALVLAAILVAPRVRQLVSGLSPSTAGFQDLAKGEGPVDPAITQLLVYRKSGERAELLSDGAEARAGALLQLAYVAASGPYGTILSIDGRGGVTRHFPADEGGPTLLSLNKRVLQPSALELDDAPGFERFFLVTSAEPVDVAAVMSKAVELAKDPAAARRADLDLPAGLKQTSVLVLKGEGSR
jgi:hypothetical protein